MITQTYLPIPIAKTKTFQEFFYSLPGAQKAFHLADHCIRCMDEGTPGGKRRAGSGILDPDIVATLKNHQAEIEGIYAHQGCGAAALASGGIDQSGAEKISQIAREAGIPFKGLITEDQLQRPAHQHIACILYYTALDFDPSQVEGLPAGFVLSRDIIDKPEQAIKEGKIALDIAFHHHISPFYIVVVAPAKSPAILKQMLDEVEQIKGGNKAIKIDTLIAL
ncbi:hypothetical protein HY385_01870 [Candidatus Daviesbacteria bacterium]|nr:hypothetical protein [Candidatus Daviesbacteria bacterium]